MVTKEECDISISECARQTHDTVIHYNDMKLDVENVGTSKYRALFLENKQFKKL